MAEVACFACSKLVKASNRRTLGSSERSQRFLETFGGVPAAVTRKCLTQLTYVCKPCLTKLESGQKVVDDLKQLTSKCRQHFGLSGKSSIYDLSSLLVR